VARYLPLLEGLTELAILPLVGLNFRSVVAALIALAASGVAFGANVRVAGIAGAALGLPVPAELEPLLVALLLGIVTGYTVFDVAALQIGLDSARDRRRTVGFAEIHDRMDDSSRLQPA
jgi:RND superfamily putative drug exporter